MMVLITGGSKNGKSHMGETIAAWGGLPRYYIATMEPYGDEAHAAIDRHRKIRAGKGFETIEKYTDIDEISLPEGCAVLLECVCNLCANEMFTAKAADPVGKIVSGVGELAKKAETMVVITNQVGEDGIAYPSETMEYIKNMGEINRILAEMADCVIEAVYGIPIILKGVRPRCI